MPLFRMMVLVVFVRSIVHLGCLGSGRGLFLNPRVFEATFQSYFAWLAVVLLCRASLAGSLRALSLMLQIVPSRGYLCRPP
eukprot:2813018-Amphidinium_carterae.1